MKTMVFGKTGETVSRLGFGTMRLPLLKSKDGEKSKVDEQQAIEMIRSSIDGGLSYVDTAYIYHDEESEVITGKALKDGYRDKVLLTTKLPVWLVESEKQMDEFLDEQLKKLDVSYVDFYLLHSLDIDSYHKIRSLNYKSFFERAMKDGRIRFPGFSFHDDYNAFIEIIDDFDWYMAQIQFNYLDDQYQATVEGLKYAGQKKIPVVVMEPLRGGALANPPNEIIDMIESHPRGYSPVEWAFRYVADFPEVTCILSGMSNQAQVDDNMRIFASLESNNLSDEDKKFISKLKEAYEKRIAVPCTDCKYCQPCPQGVNIPRIFNIYNDTYRFDDIDRLVNRYKAVIKDKQDASYCVDCGACESVCPQGIGVIEILKTIDSKATKTQNAG